MQTLTILWIVWAAIFINWFRWTKAGRDGRTACWIIGCGAGLILLLISWLIPLTQKSYEIDQPKILEYGNFNGGGGNYIFYSWNGKDQNFTWISDEIEKEKAKKFYKITDISYFNVEFARTTNSIERR